MKLEDFGKAKKLVTKLNKLKAQRELWVNATKMVDTQIRANIKNPKSGGDRVEYLDMGMMNFELLQGYMLNILDAEISKLTKEFENL